ncbi:MAG: PTS transporter subunit EIIA, partial [Candidatus Eisenbacteria bacterium]|nr:PTS transporter subunit EIIA [Candidatus Eisenbacteria bacterium]
PIIGIVAPIFFIFQMGWESILFSVGLVVSSILWYRFYGKSRARRDGAIFHVFERWGQQRDKNLDRELRGIMKEKGLRDEDPFDEVVARSYVIDAEKESFEQLVKLASANLAGRVPLDAEELESRFLQGTLIGATPVTHGVALPHLRVVGVEHPELVLVRVRLGVTIHLSSPLQKRESDQEVKAIFFLVSPDADPTRHLRMLAQIAGSVDKDTFDDAWKAARDEAEIKEVLLRDERYRNIVVDTEGKSADLIGKALKDIVIPDGALIALIKRADETVIPRGHTVLQDGDRLTIIGTSKGVDEFHRRYD